MKDGGSNRLCTLFISFCAVFMINVTQPRKSIVQSLRTIPGRRSSLADDGFSLDDKVAQVLLKLHEGKIKVIFDIV